MFDVEVTPRAAIQLAAAATWWAKNRPAVPDAIRVDFQEATVLLAVETFERLMQATAPQVKVEHIVNEELLADAQRVGADDPALVKRVHGAMVEAAATGASIVVCTCSTIGGLAEKTPTQNCFAAVRIDRAMADRAVKLGYDVLSYHGDKSWEA